MTTFYRQCQLRKDTTSQIVWIPDCYAHNNRVLKIKENGVWEDGWKVMFIGSQKLEEKYLPDSHKEIKAHRKKTGDSMPKKRDHA